MPRSSLRTIDELAIALDRDEQSVAETWRLVSEAAAQLGFPRPSYPNIRRLVLAERLRRRLRRELHDVLKEAASSFAAGRVPNFDYTMGRLHDAAYALAEIEACVSETQASRARPR
jgi:hypothetical protein